MKKLLKLLSWVDDNLIKISLIAYIFFIPLYPKFPLRTMDYTYISIRVDDLFIALVYAIFIIQLLRRKVKLNLTLLAFFLAFWAADFLSLLSGFFVTKTLVYRQVAILNALRRIQYMGIFFIALSSVRNRRDLMAYLYMIMSALFIVSVYGIGQKFFGWPAVQTMNPEFALGHILYLTPEARISSTFAGHYDLAAYLVFLMPLTLSLFILKKKFTYPLIFVISVFALMLTASRISYGAYIVSVLAFVVFMKKPKLLVFFILVTGLFTYLSKNLTYRFFRTLQVKQIFVNEKTGQVVVPQTSNVKELPAGSFYIQISKTPDNNNEEANKALVNQKLIDDLMWDASRSGKMLSASQAAEIASTISAKLKPINTVVSDISVATRLQVEWPRALKALAKNPLLGTGPGSITESTDNDYLRWLGEFGLLGFTAFLGVLFGIARIVFLGIKRLNSAESNLGYGFLFGLFGLMLNATYIDVFEASKVAYTFWLVAGIFVAYFQLKTGENKSNLPRNK